MLLGASAYAVGRVHERIRGVRTKPSSAPVVKPASPDPRCQRASIYLMSLPPEVSAALFKELGPDQVQRITAQIGLLPVIGAEERQQVMLELYEAARSLVPGTDGRPTSPEEQAAWHTKLGRECPDITARLISALWLEGKR